MEVTRNKALRGFTLLELLVVLAIVAVLGGLLAPVLQVSVQRSKEQQLRHALQEIRDALDAYKRASEEGTIETAPEGSGYPPSLELLAEGVTPRDPKKKGKMYFLRRVPRDPMNEQRELAAAQTWGKRSYDSEPQAPREGADVYDVFSLSTKVGLDGTPYAAW